MTSMHEFSQFLVFKFFFVILGRFEILSHYLIIDNSPWLREDVEWIIDEVFREKLMV